MQGDSTLQAPPSSPFQTKDWAAAFSSQPGEFDYWIEEVEGTIPEYLSGTLFRNGPGNFGARHPSITCCTSTNGLGMHPTDDRHP